MSSDAPNNAADVHTSGMSRAGSATSMTRRVMMGPTSCSNPSIIKQPRADATSQPYGLRYVASRRIKCGSYGFASGSSSCMLEAISGTQVAAGHPRGRNRTNDLANGRDEFLLALLGVFMRSLAHRLL